MKRFITTLVIMSAMVGLWGCESGVEWGLDLNLVGTWLEINPTYSPYSKATFNSNGLAEFGHSKDAAYYSAGAWHTEGTTLTVAFFANDYSTVYQYKQFGDRLTLTTLDGYAIEYIRM